MNVLSAIQYNINKFTWVFARSRPSHVCAFIWVVCVLLLRMHINLSNFFVFFSRYFVVRESIYACEFVFVCENKGLTAFCNLCANCERTKTTKCDAECELLRYDSVERNIMALSPYTPHSYSLALSLRRVLNASISIEQKMLIWFMPFSIVHVWTSMSGSSINNLPKISMPTSFLFYRTRSNTQFELWHLKITDLCCSQNNEKTTTAQNQPEKYVSGNYSALECITY